MRFAIVTTRQQCSTFASWPIQGSPLQTTLPYDQNLGVPRHCAQAVVWSREAATRDATALNMLGAVFCVGGVVAADYAQAVVSLRKAGRQRERSWAGRPRHDVRPRPWRAQFAPAQAGVNAFRGIGVQKLPPPAWSQSTFAIEASAKMTPDQFPRRSGWLADSKPK